MLIRFRNCAEGPLHARSQTRISRWWTRACNEQLRSRVRTSTGTTDFFLLLSSGSISYSIWTYNQTHVTHTTHHTPLGCMPDLKPIIPTTHIYKTFTTTRASLATDAPHTHNTHKRILLFWCSCGPAQLLFSSLLIFSDWLHLLLSLACWSEDQLHLFFAEKNRGSSSLTCHICMHHAWHHHYTCIVGKPGEGTG